MVFLMIFTLLSFIEVYSIKKVFNDADNIDCDFFKCVVTERSDYSLMECYKDGMPINCSLLK